MDHVAIMHKPWNLISKVLDGRKKIESRWSKNKITPFGKVVAGDVIYFKNSGEPIIARATATKVVEYENLSSKKVREILTNFGGNGQIAFSNLKSAFTWAKNKKYCTLIYFNNPERIKPFNINKNGFGIGAAWLSLKDVSKIKIAPKS